MGGKFKSEMNSMFDNRGRHSERQQYNVKMALDSAQKKYDQQLYSDWIMRVYRKCSTDCIQPPQVNSSASLSDFERNCATNCIRKHEAGYKLYEHLSPQLFTNYMETTNIDPDEFFAQMNNMSVEQFRQMEQSKKQGLPLMDDVRSSYMSKGQANEEKYYNSPPKK